MNTRNVRAIEGAAAFVLAVMVGGCSIGESRVVSGTNGIVVEHGADQIVIRLDENAVAEQVSRRQTFRDEVVRLLAADSAFQEGARGPQGVKGDTGAQGVAGPPGPSFLDMPEYGEMLRRLAVLDEAAYCPRLVTRPSATFPAGQHRVYATDLSTPEVVRCRFGDDEMVKVGSFWVDRFEASVEQGPDAGTIGTGPANDTTARAVSRAGVLPQVGVTWFQAAALCANAGKHLCTNGQWQVAASGTFDPPMGAPGATGLAPVSGPCNTLSSGIRATGRAGTTPTAATSCISRYGAEDMVGNVLELADLWASAGPPNGSSPGQERMPWPAGYGGDVTWNLDGEANNGVDVVAGTPAVAIRGGAYSRGPIGGMFEFGLHAGPSGYGTDLGFRCCAGGQ